MTRPGSGAGKSPVAITAPGIGAPRLGAPGRGNKLVVGLVALGLACHVLRSRRVQEAVAVTVIALGALRGLGQENRANTMARLSAWNKRQVQLLERQAERQVHRVERQAERQARAVKGAGQMARSGPVSIAAGDDAVAGEGRRA